MSYEEAVEERRLRRLAAGKVYARRYPQREIELRQDEINHWATPGYDIMTDIAIDIQMELDKR